MVSTSHITDIPQLTVGLPPDKAIVSGKSGKWKTHVIHLTYTPLPLSPADLQRAQNTVQLGKIISHKVYLIIKC